MKMKSVFIREQKRYTQRELVKLFDGPENEVVQALKRLKQYGVLKAVKASEEQKNLTDLIEKDIEIADVEIGDSEYFYVFTFVGVITIAGRVLKCYPKYLLHSDEPLNELKQVIKVIKKHNAREQHIRMLNDAADNTSINMLSVMLWLLQDFFENGSYSNLQDIIETNGMGEILWDKTINETFTLISNNRPYYPELYTRKRVTDEQDYFRRLHESILTKCSKEMEDADLLELFDITRVDLTDETIDDFGEASLILDRLYKELNTQFNTRKQLVLKMLYAYIANSGSHTDDLDSFSMFGTNSFNLVWEKVCADILDNQLERHLGELDLPYGLHDEFRPSTKLIDIIDHPMWFGRSEEGYYNHQAKDTLVPDIISIFRDGEESKCIIFDAKYYNLQLEKDKPLRGQPGIESVAKQYLYQMAYIDFLDYHSVMFHSNCFIMPTEGDETIKTGYVTLGFLQRMGLREIQIILLSAEKAYQMFLNGEKMKLPL